MGKVKNILFVMYDQLRADYLGCAGHPTIQTPHIDAFAKTGVLFNRAYCQAPVCGPSRVSFYTGRYVSSHGAGYNNVPFSLDQWTMGDYLAEVGMRSVLVGKTHMASDHAGMKRLQIDPVSDLGVWISQSGFEPFERDDGLHPSQAVDPNLAYNNYLRALGYDSENPWHDFANSAEGPDGEILSGWNMRHARLPARLPDEHTETPYMTDRAMDFIETAGDQPWCLHFSLIKPHWPYVAPTPYNDMYGPNQILPVNQSVAEMADPHPVVAAFQGHEGSENFRREEVRQTVIPTYMGLITQCDDQFGRLMAFLKEQGRLDDTMIVITADHGDYLGDHGLGEKDLLHEEVARIPMIIYDPDAAADGRRGSVDDRLVEAIDLIPTFLDSQGGDLHPHRLEGRSLLPLLRGEGEVTDWRDAVFSETDYAFHPARNALGVAPDRARAYMVRTEDWKYIFYEGYRPQLFHLAEDPKEQKDLGTDPGHADQRAELHEKLFHWLRNRAIRTTMSNDVVTQRTGNAKARGYLFGVW
ncbi:MAG: sulfatase-like hydrolase/transferase [Alphaproteobacteria bacterium]|nr:sulfatase-like hydrolase/transferase [Alphaproteobacteria bacterium]